MGGTSDKVSRFRSKLKENVMQVLAIISHSNPSHNASVDHLILQFSGKRTVTPLQLSAIAEKFGVELNATEVLHASSLLSTYLLSTVHMQQSCWRHLSGRLVNPNLTP